MNALWTLMTIQSEINRQSVEQGNVVITDIDVDKATKQMIKDLETFDEDKIKDMFKTYNANYETMRKEDKVSRQSNED